MKLKKVTFITYHNWETKRHGGFHQLAEYTTKRGVNTIFFSFCRPYYSIFKRNERLNWRIIRLLSKGKKYNVGKYKITNITWPTLALPGFLRNYFSYSINKWCMCHSCTPFKTLIDKYLYDTDCFVFESCEAVYLLDIIKKYFPKALIVYRPSDPIVDFSNEKTMIAAERKMIQNADKILLVNAESLLVYKESFPEISEENKFYILPNGVDVKLYLDKYEIPELMKNKLSALYIGAFNVDWNLMYETAKKLPNITFIIITPFIISKDVINRLKTIPNLKYIPGIVPSEVPRWVTNANLIIQPYPKTSCHCEKKSLGLTAQNYKAMAAKKPIVTYMVPMHLSKYGIVTTNTYEDFIREVSDNINKSKVDYNFNVNDRNWDSLCERFFNIIDEKE